MGGVFVGFGVIAIIVAIGFFLERGHVLGDNAHGVMGKLIFFVATPCLLFDMISTSHPADLFGDALAVQVLSVLVIGVIYLLVAVPVMRLSAGEAIVGTMSATYVNAGNLGIPLALYALGDSSQVAPIMLFQMALYTPILLLGMDIAHGSGGGVLATVRHVLVNPVLIASVAALAIAFGGWQVPDVIYEPIHLLAGISVPAMLLNFGMSLAQRRPFKNLQHVGAISYATVLKSFAQPVAAYLIAHYGFGIDGHELMVCVVMAALPTAQNTYNYAVRYGVGQTIARDTAFATTVISVPVVAAIVALLY